MRTLAEYCLPLVRVGGLFVAAKGYEPQEEVRNAKRAIDLMGASVLECSSGVIANATCGDNFRSSSTRDDGSQTCRTFNLSTHRFKSSLSADLISSISFKAQYGHFQRWFFDLTRIGARLDVRSGAKFLAAAANLAHDVYTSQKPNVNTLQAVCPDITLSLQQQIVGPFSFRVDSRISFDMKNTTYLAHIDDSVFAVEYAMKVLGSAKATAWYSPKHGEGMIELRFFET